MLPTMPFYLYNFSSDAALITGDAYTLLGFPASNITIASRSGRTWRTSNINSAAGAFLKWDLGSAIAIDTFCLAGSNLYGATGGAFRLLGSASDPGSNYAAWAATAAVDVPLVFSSNSYTKYTWTATKSYQYWAVFMTDVTGLSYIEVGRAAFGTRLTLTRGYARDNIRISRPSTSTAMRTQSGHVVGTKLTALTQYDYSHYNLDSADQLSLLALWDETDLLTPFFFDAYPDSATHDQLTYGVNMSDFSRNLFRTQLGDVPMSIKEVA